MTIIKEITSILNNEQTSLGEKLSMLRGVRDYRRGNNRITSVIVLNILQEHFLTKDLMKENSYSKMLMM